MILTGEFARFVAFPLYDKAMWLPKTKAAVQTCVHSCSLMGMPINKILIGGFSFISSAAINLDDLPKGHGDLWIVMSQQRAAGEAGRRLQGLMR